MPEIIIKCSINDYMFKFVIVEKLRHIDRVRVIADYSRTEVGIIRQPRQ